MEVILLERIAKLGQMGDIVTVKDGFARNFLLPQRKALHANSENVKKFEQSKAQLEITNLERRTEAEKIAAGMHNLSTIVLRQASDSGQLYGSVSARDIANALENDGYKTSRKQIKLKQMIKQLGITETEIALHPEVSVQIKVNVARSLDEAKIQAGGHQPIQEIEEKEENENELSVAEEFFDSEELAARAREAIEATDDSTATTKDDDAQKKSET